MMNVVIVDDEILVLDLLKSLLCSEPDVRIVGEFTSSKTALCEIPQLRPDVVFLDIEMPGLNGMELAIQLLDKMGSVNIVFVTAYDQYAIEAFKLNAIHYILKPPGKWDIQQALERARAEGTPSALKPESQIFIRLFGGITIEDEDGNGQVKWPTAKAEELFALFMHRRDKGIDKWRIIEALWPNSSEGKGEQLLYSTVYRLKKTLQDAGIQAVVSNRIGVYTLQINNAWCDLWEYEERLGKVGEAAGFDENSSFLIFSLYTGPLFGNREYSWGQLHRLALERDYERICEGLCSYYRQESDFERVHEIQLRMAMIIE